MSRYQDTLIYRAPTHFVIILLTDVIKGPPETLFVVAAVLLRWPDYEQWWNGLQLLNSISKQTES